MATSVTVGDGRTDTFWHCTWLQSMTLAQLFPTLYKCSTRKQRTVAAALHNNTWIKDLRRSNVADLAVEFLVLWRAIRDANITLQSGVPDDIKWNFEPSGIYSTKSAYNLQFNATIQTNFKQLIWQVWAPGKHKFFCWLLLQDRLWCNDRLQRRGWTNGYFCQLCMRNLECSMHLFWECPMGIQIWQRTAHEHGCMALDPASWTQCRKSIEQMQMITAKAATTDRKRVQSIMFIVLWQIWQERNQRTFRQSCSTVNAVLGAIRRDMDSWRLAGAKCLQTPLGDPG